MSTRDEVEAVLLNSQGDPYEETVEAMGAVVRFAMLECEMTPTELRSALDKLILKTEAEEDQSPLGLTGSAVQR